MASVSLKDATPGGRYRARFIDPNETGDYSYAGDGLVAQQSWVAGPSSGRGRTPDYYTPGSVLMSDSFQFVDGTSRPAGSYAVGRDTEARSPSNLAPKQEEARKAILLSGAESGFIPEQRSGASRLEDEPQFLKRKLSGSLAR